MFVKASFKRKFIAIFLFYVTQGLHRKRKFRIKELNDAQHYSKLNKLMAFPKKKENSH